MQNLFANDKDKAFVVTQNHVERSGRAKICKLVARIPRFHLIITNFANKAINIIQELVVNYTLPK